MLACHKSGKSGSLCKVPHFTISDLESDPFLNTALQRFTCDLYYCFSALLAPVSAGIITGKHYAKNSITKLNGRSKNGTCNPATRNCNKTEEPSEN